MDARGSIYAAQEDQVPPEDAERLTAHFEEIKAEERDRLLATAEALRDHVRFVAPDIA